MERELHILIQAMRSAGQKALDLAGDGIAVQTKSDHSPVTTADLAVDRLIHEVIARHFPDDGWLSEERPDAMDRLTKKRVWILDPIDGTRAFIKNIPQFCISAALVEDGDPVVGAILNPSTDEWFTAIRGEGIRLLAEDGGAGEPSGADDLPLVLVNPWELRHGRLSALSRQARCRPVGSIAYALATVAAGRADATIMLDGGSEWDVAAGTLLIEESGGTVTDAHGKRVRFNRPDPRLHGTIATGRGVPDTLRTALLALAASPDLKAGTP
ncbi:MAG TPA: 3'(2'),5'-bisphosphate nucleotidase CysQ [Nitrospiraceae bacterium]|nr:3'(2'),5'-bisphosphate nucleotidase CysQ [Nitrospiraceae bacterium]